VDGPCAEVWFADIVDGLPVLDAFAWRRFYDAGTAELYVFCLRFKDPPPAKPD
jgi:hypothetical protein